MFIIIGWVVVLSSVIAGYVLHHGQMMVLYQPTEFLIIGGAAIGSLIVATPIPVIKRIVTQVLRSFSSPPGKKQYLELLVMMYEFFVLSKQSGLMGLEQHFESPKNSTIFKKYPTFLKNHHALDFMSDTMRVIIMGGVPAHDIDELLDKDIESHHNEEAQAPASLNRVADSLPGLGIVAAVLGVVITMNSIGGPAEEIGMKVAAALVGTFLGVLLAYGIVGPLAANMEARNNDEGEYYKVMKQGLLGFYKGFPPVIAVEFARRSIPNEVRPGFAETEETCRKAKAAK